jgi:hypothetical protein
VDPWTALLPEIQGSRFLWEVEAVSYQNIVTYLAEYRNLETVAPNELVKGVSAVAVQQAAFQ